MERSLHIALFGYRRRDVENFLEDVRQQYESLLTEKQQRMIQLRDENARLSQCEGDYQEKLSQITQLLLSAQDQSNRIISEAYQKAESIVSHSREKAAYLEHEILQRKQILEDTSAAVMRLTTEFHGKLHEQDSKLIISRKDSASKQDAI